MKWWGYFHRNGSIQVKRFFDVRDIEEAAESPFVLNIVNPFEAEGREDALVKMTKVQNRMRGSE